MPFVFTESQKSDLRALRAAGNYADAYAYVVNATTQLVTSPDGTVTVMPAADVPANVWQWFQGAEQVNRGVGPFSDFIREYTAEQYRIRTGNEPPANFTQTGSNAIADAVIRDIVQNGVLPNLTQIGFNDATQSVAAFPDGNPAAWSGNLLFVPLGDRSFFDQNLLHSGSGQTDPYDFLAAVHSAAHAGSSAAGSFTLAGIAQFISTGLSLAAGPGATIDPALMANVDSDAVSYFTSMYGQSPYYLDSHGIVLDVQGHNGALTAVGGQLVYGADGDDVLSGTTGPNILDGGSGDDTALFQTNSSLSVVIQGKSSTAAYIGNVSGAGGDNALYRIEHIVTGAGNDSFMINGFSTGITALSIDAGAGNDTVSFQNLTAGIAFQASTGQVTIGGTVVSLSGVESIIGGHGNDVFKLTDTGTFRINGGDGYDTVDFSDAPNGVIVDTSNWTGIEHFIGSSGIDSFTLRGSIGQYVELGDGDDGVTAGLASNVIDGGSGNDIIDYRAETYGITIQGSGGTATVLHNNGQSTDTLTSFETFLGTSKSDVFIGGGGGYNYYGGGGQDFFKPTASGDHYYASGTANSNILDLSVYSGAGRVVLGATSGTLDGSTTFERVIKVTGGTGSLDIDAHGAASGTTILGSSSGDHIEVSGSTYDTYGNQGSDTIVLDGLGFGVRVGGDGKTQTYGDHDILDLSQLDPHNPSNMIPNISVVLSSPSAPDGSGVSTYNGRITTYDNNNGTVFSNFEEIKFGAGYVLNYQGTASADHLEMGPGPGNVSGGGGDDYIYAGPTAFTTVTGKTTLDGGADNDVIVSYRAATVTGGDGNDTIQGSAYADDIRGGTGTNVIHAGGGSDVMYDELYLGKITSPLHTTLDGGDGNDVFSSNQRMEAYSFSSDGSGGLIIEKFVDDPTLGHQSVGQEVLSNIERASWYLGYIDASIIDPLDAVAILDSQGGSMDGAALYNKLLSFHEVILTNASGTGYNIGHHMTDPPQTHAMAGADMSGVFDVGDSSYVDVPPSTPADIDYYYDHVMPQIMQQHADYFLM